MIDECLDGTEQITQLRRLATAIYAVAHKERDPEKLREHLRGDQELFCDEDALSSALLAPELPRDERIARQLLVLETLLESDRFSLSVDELSVRVSDLASRLQAAADEELPDPLTLEGQQIGAYLTALTAAWANDGEISADESGVMLALRRYFGLSLRDHWQLESRLGRFPRSDGSSFSESYIENVVRNLQKAGVIWLQKSDDGRWLAQIPRQIGQVLRKLFRPRLRRGALRELYAHASFNKPDYRALLIAVGENTSGKREEQVERLVQKYPDPAIFLGALKLPVLKTIAEATGLKKSQPKAALIDQIISSYDGMYLHEQPPQAASPEGRLVEYIGDLANRRYDVLRDAGIITKQEDVEHKFEKATTYLFGEGLGLSLRTLRGKARADGYIHVSDDEVIIWDCKSKESEVKLTDHIYDQFRRYIRAEEDKNRRVLGFVVVGPSFTRESEAVALAFEREHDVEVCLLEAEALRGLVETWRGKHPDSDFPAERLALTRKVAPVDVGLLAW
jgi:uncharacterized protein YdaU (DUF1376 family)